MRHDIKSLIRMFRDLREGSVRVGYPMALGEFAEIFDYLRDRGQKLVAEKEKMKNMGLLDHLSQLNNRRYFEEGDFLEHRRVVIFGQRAAKKINCAWYTCPIGVISEFLANDCV